MVNQSIKQATKHMSFPLHCMVLHSIPLLSIPFHLKWKGPICSLLEASLEAWRWSFYCFLFDTGQAQNPRRHLRFGGCGGIQRLSRCSGRILVAEHKHASGLWDQTKNLYEKLWWKQVHTTSCGNLTFVNGATFEIFCVSHEHWQFLISPKSG